VGALVGVQNVDTPLVAFGLRPWRSEERVHEGQRLLDRVHAPADADQLRVVVLAGQSRGLDAPRQRATRTGYLVRGDLLTVTRSPQHDAQAVRVGHRARSGSDAERRIVVLGVVTERAAIDGLVSSFLQVLDDLLLELESGVI